MAGSDIKKIGGIHEKYFLKNIEKVHNCYSDLKNNWNENAFDSENTTKNFIIISVFIFILGFVLSQITIYIYTDITPQQELETFKAINCTITQENIQSFIDYALDKNGGTILPEYSTDEYLGWFSSLSTNRRSSLISDINSPGNCWPFSGHYGYIGIGLGQAIYPRHFTIFHINSLQYETAPKHINVYSLSHNDETQLLASYFFDLKIKGEKRKNWGIFECEYYCDEPTDKVLLEVVDNYGGVGTCVYQFKVHGIGVGDEDNVEDLKDERI